MSLDLTSTARTSADPFPLSLPASVTRNANRVELIETSIARGESRLTNTGAVSVTTGEHTGRSAQDKFIVRDELTESRVWWDNNKAMTPDAFARLLEDFQAHASSRHLHVQDLFAGADPKYRLNSRIYTEFAWHALFIRYLLRRPSVAELAEFKPEFTVVNLPSFRADPERHGCRSETVIACDFSRRLVLIGGTEYAGETKKSVFGYLNFAMPDRGVMPMHCSANHDERDGAAVFFGLSGTGKTTLSADASRDLLGDDEHGWSPDGIFNFEGGCYAKTIRLSHVAEPEIYAASNSFGTVLENVVLDDTRRPDFDNAELTENTRSAYPLDAIPNASPTGRAGHPTTIVMLCADAFGVLPPIAKLSPSQAMYHFLSGYTAKVAGTEKGVGAQPQATFSTCFGAPFMPRHPSDYGNMLRDLIAEHGAQCWLVNTGWTGGKYGDGQRMPIQATRALLNAALSGGLDDADMRVDPLFGFEVPTSVAGVDSAILDPRATWSDARAYDAQAAGLVRMFQVNFEKFASHVDDAVLSAAPSLQQAAE
ncbi:MAG: phosphoenolpyruvate carboxykinase [Pseudomonadota bacterium]